MANTKIILIAHRGLTNGPDPEKENNPKTIKEALSLGFDAEIDVWRKDNKWFLGHNEPKYKVTQKFFHLYHKNLWIHAKDIFTLNYLRTSWPHYNYFWHVVDKVTLTSKNYLWTFPGEELYNNSICVLPENYMQGLGDCPKLTCAGICSDYIGKIREIL